jgi:oligopeptide transport system permease protein
MIKMIASRLFWAVPTLLAVITVTFFLMRAAPGGPFDSEQQLSPVVEAQMRERYGLDQPLLTQYGRFLGGVVQGDFGPSYKYKDFSVAELIRDGLPGAQRLAFWLCCWQFFWVCHWAWWRASIKTSRLILLS